MDICIVLGCAEEKIFYNEKHSSPVYWNLGKEME
jgi:hypothetical protein